MSKERQGKKLMIEVQETRGNDRMGSEQHKCGVCGRIILSTNSTPLTCFYCQIPMRKIIKQEGEKNGERREMARTKMSEDDKGSRGLRGRRQNNL